MTKMLPLRRCYFELFLLFNVSCLTIYFVTLSFFFFKRVKQHSLKREKKIGLSADKINKQNKKET